MKILIVGVKGFIGSHAAKFFSTKHEVWGCDVFTDYTEKNFILINSLSVDYHKVFSEHSFDICINCAGAASVPDSLKDPARDFELNVHLVFLLVEAIRSNSPTCKFINLSSAAVYGNPQTLPVAETHSLNPLSPYGAHKKHAEALCAEYFTFFKINCCSVRIFSAYGPGLRKQILWDLFMKCKRSDLLELFGTGLETRDYIFVDDICRALDCLVEKASFTGEVYNLGFGQATPLNELTQIFIRELNWTGHVKFTGMARAGDPDFWQADISKLLALGYKPRISIKDGIKKYVSWLSSLG